ncbi:MAG: hypothetical protein FADNKDHG_01434 [Holosporales bacterium]
MHYLYIFLCLIIYGLNASQPTEEEVKEGFDHFIQEVSRAGEEFHCLFSRPITQEEAALRRIQFGTPSDFKETISRYIPENPVKMPKEYQPFINVLKELFPRTKKGIDFSASYATVKERLVPIKDNFIAIMENKITNQYLKSFDITKKRFESFYDELHKKYDHERLMPLFLLDLMINNYKKLMHHPCDDSYRFFINNIIFKFKFSSFYPQYDSCEPLYKDVFNIGINFILSQPKEIIDQYCPLSFRKMLFPFNLIDFFLTCFEAFDGSYKNKRDFHDFFIEDRPFMEQFELMLRGHQIGAHPHRYIENMYFMTDDPSFFAQ